jgi:hypothetical protein
MRRLPAGILVSGLAPFACAQSAGAIEVLAGPGAPSYLLQDHLAAAGDAEDLILFDVGFGIRDAVVSLQGCWWDVEACRAMGLRKLLGGMAAGFAGAGAGDEMAALAGATSVACNLVAWSGMVDEETAAAREERLEVLGGGRGRLRFGAGDTSVDWRIAQPVGAYVARPHQEPDDLPGLFRATVYLQAYLRHWPASTRDRWLAAARTQIERRVAPELARCDAAFAVLTGAPLLAPGVVGEADASDVEHLERTKGPGDPWPRLRALFTTIAAPEAATVRHAMLGLSHALATASVDGEFFVAMAPEQWRAKWLDGAAFVHVGLRQVDALSIPRRMQRVRPPRVVVEPLPRVWAALRRLDQRTEEVRRLLHPDWTHRTQRSWIDDVLDALAAQAVGKELDAKLEARLLQVLLRSFIESDRLLDLPVELEGDLGRFRRAGPYLVRIPIRWRGETRRALALHLLVEQEVSPGVWQPPPWGIVLDAAACHAAMTR